MLHEVSDMKSHLYAAARELEAAKWLAEAMVERNDVASELHASQAAEAVARALEHCTDAHASLDTIRAAITGELAQPQSRAVRDLWFACGAAASPVAAQ